MTERPQARPPGWSVRLKLTLSYAGFLLVAGAVLLAAVWLFLLRYVPDGNLTAAQPGARGGRPGLFIPNQSDLVRAFMPRAVQALVFLLLFGLVGGWLLAGRMLAPLNRISLATRLAAEGSLSHRIRLEGRRDELRELADSFDGMLAQLEADIAEQQRFAANASHELRTPLATMQTLLEVARADPGAVDAELFERLHAVNARAIKLTEALLLLSRADQRAFAREPIDLSLVVEEAAETLLELAEEQDVTLDITGEVAPTTGSQALLLQMATNLLHNAIVHNRLGGGTVEATTHVGDDHVLLTVENTGPELAPELVSTLTEPFQRGAERRRSDHGGVGLGLAIVSSIVRAHDGDLELAPRAGGGLTVAVRLPLEQR